MTEHGLSFLNVKELSTRFNSEINPHEYLKLRQIIRHLASCIRLNIMLKTEEGYMAEISDTCRIYV